jgi:virginiamycin B lyase
VRLRAGIGVLVFAAVVGTTATASGASITVFTAGISGTPALLAAGPDGNVWFTEPDRIGRISPSGHVTEFSQGISPGTSLGDITAGPDGNMWFVARGGPAGSRVGRIAPAGDIVEFPLGRRGANRIVAGPDGALRFTGIGEIGRITTAGEVSRIRTPTVTDLYGITAGPDGNIWAVAYGGSVLRVTPAGVVATFRGLGSDAGNPSITSGPGRAVWVTGDHKVGRITPTGRLAVIARAPRYLASLYDSTFGLASGPDGNLWSISPDIVRTTPAGAQTLFGLPRSMQAQHIVAGPDGNLWFSVAKGLGRLQPDAPTVSISRRTTPTTVRLRPDGSATLTEPKISCPAGHRACRVSVSRGGGAALASPDQMSYSVKPGTTARARLKLTRATMATLRRSKRLKVSIVVDARRGRFSGITPRFPLGQAPAEAGAEATYRHIPAITLLAPR